jgi:hypothetical protein
MKTSTQTMDIQTALDIITTARPGQARTFDPADGCVDVWKQVYPRRANGQIIGLSFGTAKPHRVTLRKPAVEVAQEIERIAADRLVRQAEYEAGKAKDRAAWEANATKVREEIAELEAALVTHPAATAALALTLGFKREELARWEGYIAEQK